MFGVGSSGPKGHTFFWLGLQSHMAHTEACVYCLVITRKEHKYVLMSLAPHHTMFSFSIFLWLTLYQFAAVSLVILLLVHWALWSTSKWKTVAFKHQSSSELSGLPKESYEPKILIAVGIKPVSLYQFIGKEVVRLTKSNTCFWHSNCQFVTQGSSIVVKIRREASLSWLTTHTLMCTDTLLHKQHN